MFLCGSKNADRLTPHTCLVPHTFCGLLTESFAPGGSEKTMNELKGSRGAPVDRRGSTPPVSHAILSLGLSCQCRPWADEGGEEVEAGRPPRSWCCPFPVLCKIAGIAHELA